MVTAAVCAAPAAQSAEEPIVGTLSFDVYDRTSVATLLGDGLAYMEEGVHTDSAMICLTAAAARYYDKSQSANDAVRSIEAMSAVAFLYYYVCHDWQRGYERIVEALAACDEGGYTEEKAGLYLNLGRYYSVIAVTDSTMRYARKALDCYRTAFRTALEGKDWTLLPLIFCNLYDIAARLGDMNVINDATNDYRSLRFATNVPMARFCQLLLKGHDAMERGDYVQAAKAYNLMKSAADTKYMPMRYALLAMEYQAEALVCAGEDDKAWERRRMMRDTADVKDVMDMRVRYSSAFARYHDAAGDRDSAYVYTFRSLLAADSLALQKSMYDDTQREFLCALHDADKTARLEAQTRAAKWNVVIASSVAAVALCAAAAIAIIAVRRPRISEGRAKRA